MPTTIVPSARDPYDVNFCYPVRELESDRVRLTPFVVSNELCSTNTSIVNMGYSLRFILL